MIEYIRNTGTSTVRGPIRPIHCRCCERIDVVRRVSSLDVAAAQDSGAKRYSVKSLNNRMNTVFTYENSESEKYTYKQDKFPHHWRGRICCIKICGKFNQLF